MGYSIKELRNVRHTSVGAEVSARPGFRPDHVAAALMAMGDTQSLPRRQQGVLARYADDMNCILAEIKRVLVPKGRAVVVVGNAAIRGVFVSNSAAITLLAERNGLTVVSERRRKLDPSKRYLPPPRHERAGRTLGKRLNEETILEMVA
jgi:SAM-dependent methyltransferase